MYYFIEPMVEDDISQVQIIESLSFTTAWSANTYRRELRNRSSCRYIVARSSVAPPPPYAPERDEPLRRSGLFNTLLTAFFPLDTTRTPNGAPLVGYGGLWLTVDDAHITTIAVDPQHRGNGLGELLLNGLIDHAFELEAQLLTLEVRVSNTVAQQLYLKYGFAEAGRRPRYYTDNGEDALIMSTEPITTAAYQEQLSTLRRQLFARLRLQADATVAPPTFSPAATLPKRMTGS